MLWLLPDNNREPYFRTTIKECAAEFNAPQFEPHITLGRLPDDRTGMASQFIADAANRFSPFTFKTENPECREEPYQKLIITLQESAVYGKLCDSFDNFFEVNGSKREDPHLSLLYSTIGCDAIKNKAKTVRGPLPKVVEVQEIAIVELRGQPGDWKLIERIEFMASR